MGIAIAIGFVFLIFFIGGGASPPNEKKQKNKANANANAWFLYQCLFPGSYTRGRQTRTPNKNPASLADGQIENITNGALT